MKITFTKNNGEWITKDQKYSIAEYYGLKAVYKRNKLIRLCDTISDAKQYIQDVYSGKESGKAAQYII